MTDSEKRDWDHFGPVEKARFLAEAGGYESVIGSILRRELQELSEMGQRQLVAQALAESAKNNEDPSLEKFRPSLAQDPEFMAARAQYASRLRSYSLDVLFNPKGQDFRHQIGEILRSK